MEDPKQFTNKKFYHRYLVDHEHKTYEGVVINTKYTKTKGWRFFVLHATNDGEQYEDTEYEITLPQLLADFMLNDFKLSE